MKDKLLVKVFNRLQPDLETPDVTTWKNTNTDHEKVVHPGGEPAEFLFQPDEQLKEVTVAANPEKTGGQRAPLYITLSSINEFDISLQLRKETALDKWTMEFKNMKPVSNIDFAEKPPVVNVTVGEDEDSDVIYPEKTGLS